ncbi:hypothetical protein [Ectopseudomonas oleovorans]|uniref:hypothetical protein n=1 Tax=Ectopseudomonas oleovorans TaxID=301 RepID=UPI001C3E6514|nr:hypothetical protein [Pseudomonas oleovorans]MBV5614701.1 hypothetical protein [Pseudomonas aeruginosa]MBV5906855.1 hypothetical protein [Pseudomonas aeruginosa]MDH2200040.1 hypothetical protein [Pseudomonas oleovorans]
MHLYAKCLLIALASALGASYAVLWFVKPSPIESTTIPPLLLKEQQGELIVWGGWKTVEGYQAHGTSAVELRCHRERGTCTEALATILHHDSGQDLEAQVFHYQITHWDEARLEAFASKAIEHCLDKHLVIHVKDRSADLRWLPSAGCEADQGRAVLIGDPL